MIYQSINQVIISQVPKTAQHILDLGCGTGSLSSHIKQITNCEVVGITYSKSEATIAKNLLEKVIICDLNNFIYSPELGQFDCIICSHVLEHLYQPQKLLNQIHNLLKNHQSCLIVALPNILHWKQRWKFLKGEFKYTEGGLMDKTHFRFFDWRTAHELLEQSGYKILESQADGSCPLPLIRKFLPSKMSHWIDRKAVNQFPGLLGFQFVFFCQSNLDS